jgi:SHAQKYF class myb-like DNA-binding protein
MFHENLNDSTHLLLDEADITSMMNEEPSLSSDLPNPLPPPRLLLPEHNLAPLAASGTVTPTSLDTAPRAATGPITRVPSSIKTSKKERENTGRWLDEEHQVFLEGLAKHGKQWKLIATMIGSRTVVQVRTHAQKYFQKMDRSSHKEDSTARPSGTGTAENVSNSVTTKRKSLPTNLPSRKKGKTRKSAALVQRNSSVSMSNLPTSAPLELVSIVSHSSVSSVDNLSTISPVGIADLDMQGMDTTWAKDSNSLYLGAFDEDEIVEDPLEWLLGGVGMQHLPESSLVPMFPEFGEDLSSGLHLQQKLVPGSSDHHYAVIEHHPHDGLDMGDPKITVQSLFLESES